MKVKVFNLKFGRVVVLLGLFGKGNFLYFIWGGGGGRIWGEC